MPCYDYFCENCQFQLKDVSQGLTEPPIIDCERCGSASMERLISAPMVFVRGDPTTIGQLSERNAKRLGSSEVEERRLREADQKKDPMKQARREMHRKINSMNEKQKDRFIRGA
jgi:putative FmdB family regulatory protein